MSGSTLEHVVPLPTLQRDAAPRDVVLHPVQPTRKPQSALFDRIGTVLGFACAIHCIVVPLAFGVLPALGLGFLADEGVDHTIVAIASVCAAIAAFIGWRTHRDVRIVLAFAASVGLLFLAHAVHDHEGLFSRVISVFGGVGLALTHLWNTRRSRSCTIDTHRGHRHLAH